MTLDDDVARKIDIEHRKSGRPVRQVINDALRRGLVGPKQGTPKRFRVRPRRLEARPGISFDDIEGLLDAIEGPTRS